MAGQSNNLELTANLNPAGVESGAKRGKTALEDLKKSAGTDGAAGGFDDLAGKAGEASAAAQRTSPAITGVGTAAAAAVPKAQQLGQAVVGVAGDLQRVAASGPSVASLGPILARVGGSAGPLAGAALAAAAALKLVSDEVARQITKASEFNEKLSQQKAILDRNTVALAAAARGQIGYGASLDETVKNLDRLTVSHGRNTLAIEAMAKAAGVTAPGGLTAMRDQILNLDAVAGAAFVRMGDAAVLWAKQNEGALRAAQEQARITGEVLPANIEKAIAALDRQKAANEGLKKSIDELNKAYSFDLEIAEKRINSLREVAKAQEESLASLKRQVQAEKESIASAQASADAARRNADAQMRALNAENVGLEEYSRRKKAIYDEMYRVVDQEAKAEEQARARLAKASTDEDAALQKHIGTLQEEADARGKIAPQVEEQVQSMQWLADAINAGTAAVEKHGEATAAAVDHVARLKEMQAEAGDTFHDGAGKIHDMTLGVDALTEALERLSQ